ncbi:LysR substrate-binding domain-containing protein [Alcaligenes sp. SDU_A2]|uniref:LysR substrate-binding domain-containing protein n=1 Tax=Alcaligenes sp. SDU_A2 TaxID=3136634 RepID=UPI002BD36640|nr:LysR substrate-binding domain-containing protein [Alcaligenes sp.]HRL27090.1 LysR substrate-binding domain-containing protein [Alcaligenes sp.]
MRHGIPSLGALQAFEATARLGSFSRAAEELSLTHSAVYRQVSGLEQRLGVQLLGRVRRRLVLTPAGRDYAARIRHHLEQIGKDTFSLVARAGVGRSVHLAVLPTLSTVWLMPRLAAFSRCYPDITVSLSVRTQPFQFGDHPFDAAIYHGRQLWPQTQGIRLFDEGELVPVCTPALAASAPLQELRHLHMSTRPDSWFDWYRSAGLEPGLHVSAGPRYELFSLILAALRADMGVALMPRFLIDSELACGDLVLAASHAMPVQEAYFFSYPTANEPGEAVLLLAQWLAQNQKEIP